MKKKTLKYLIWVTILLFGIGMLSLNANYLTYTASLPDIQLLEGQDDMPDGKDTVPATRYPVSKTVPEGDETYKDLLKKSPVDLRDPENVKTFKLSTVICKGGSRTAPTCQLLKHSECTFYHLFHSQHRRGFQY